MIEKKSAVDAGTYRDAEKRRALLYEPFNMICALYVVYVFRVLASALIAFSRFDDDAIFRRTDDGACRLCDFGKPCSLFGFRFFVRAFVQTDDEGTPRSDFRLHPGIVFRKACEFVCGKTGGAFFVSDFVRQKFVEIDRNRDFRYIAVVHAIASNTVFARPFSKVLQALCEAV